MYNYDEYLKSKGRNIQQKETPYLPKGAPKIDMNEVYKRLKKSQAEIDKGYDPALKYLGIEQKGDKINVSTVSGAFSYGTENVALGLLGAVEGVTDAIGSSWNKGLEFVTSLGGLAKNPVSEVFRNSAEYVLKNNYTKKYSDSIDERYGNFLKGQQFIGDLNESVSGLIPYAIPVIGPYAMTVSEAGQSASEAFEKSGDLDKSLLYGALKGTEAALMDKISGKFLKLPKGVISDAIEKALNNKYVKASIDILGEGAKEAISTALDPALRRMTFDENADYATIKEMIESTVLGAATSAMLEGGPKIGEVLSNVNMDDLSKLKMPNYLK